MVSLNFRDEELDFGMSRTTQCVTLLLPLVPLTIILTSRIAPDIWPTVTKLLF